MALLSLQTKGLLFMVLLSCKEVSTLAARRQVQGMLDQFKEKFSRATSMPEEEEADKSGCSAEVPPSNSSGCTRSGSRIAGAFGWATCEPEKFCFWERRWENKGGIVDRDSACYLKWFYRDDKELSSRFVAASTKLILTSEQLAQGELKAISELKGHYKQFGKASNAAESKCPQENPTLKKLKQSFKEDSVSVYLGSLETYAKDLPGYKAEGKLGHGYNGHQRVTMLPEQSLEDTKDYQDTVNELSKLSFEALGDTPLETIKGNLKKASKGGKFGSFGTKLNLEALFSTPEGASAKETVLKEKVKKMMPDVKDEELNKVSNNAKGKINEQFKACGVEARNASKRNVGTDECFGGCVENQLEEQFEELEKTQSSLLEEFMQYAEFHGLVGSVANETKAERHNRAASLLQEHADHGDQDSLHHETFQRLQRRIFSFILLGLCLCVISVLCLVLGGPFGCVVACALIGSLIFVLGAAR